MKLKKLKKKKNCKIFISDLPGRANKYMLSVPHPNFSDIFEERKIVPDLVYRIQRRDIKEGVVTKTLKKKK